MYAGNKSDWYVILHGIHHKTVKPNQKEKKFLQTKLKKASQSVNLRKLTPLTAKALDKAFPAPTEKTFDKLFEKAFFA